MGWDVERAGHGNGGICVDGHGGGYGWEGGAEEGDGGTGKIMSHSLLRCGLAAQGLTGATCLRQQADAKLTP